MRRDYVPKATAPRLATDRVMDTHPYRREDKFSVQGPVLTDKDRLKTSLLSTLVRDETIKDLTSRVTLPTIASSLKSTYTHPITERQGINHYLWHKMHVFNNLFQKNMYDKIGNMKCMGTRDMCHVYENTRGTREVAPFKSSVECYHMTWRHPSRFDYQSQWKSHQIHREGHFRTGRPQPTLRHSLYYNRPDRK